MKNACTDTLDLFGDIPSPAGPRKPVDPKASPISYQRNDEEVHSRPERDLNPEEWEGMKILMAYGISNVWAAHFVLFEGVRSAMLRLRVEMNKFQNFIGQPIDC